jgi:hypothetical protein
MIIVPDFLITSMARTTQKASLNIDVVGAENAILIRSKANGIAGNQFSVEIVFDENPGPPTCTIDGLDITYRIPSIEAYEASGPFTYNGGGVSTFLALWYAGDFNGKKAWSIAGDPSEITWPLTANGEFMLFAEGSWHMIRREGGETIMHWQADYDTDNILLIPRGAYGPENLGGWRGIAPLCDGWVDPHYSAPIAEAQYLSFVTEGFAEAPYMPGNSLVASLLEISVPNGANDNKMMIPFSRRNLDGGA